jgi:hypothetical protein
MAVGTTKPTAKIPDLPAHLPDHLELPQENGEFVRNFRELPQCFLLTESIWPILERIHPDRHFVVGHDCGIYWKLTDPPERGAICPDWCYIAGVPPDLDGRYRRSYVLWKEHIAPAVILELASDDGSKERDRTPMEGKFWIYEQAVHGGYYGIFVVETGELEVHRLEGTKYRRLTPNERGRYPIEPLGVELGVWNGHYFNEDAPWLRWFDSEGEMLPIGREQVQQEVRRVEEERRRAEEQRQLAEEEHRRAEEQRQRAERLAARLRELGVDPAGI